MKHQCINLTRVLIFIGAVLVVFQAQARQTSAQQKYNELHRFSELAIAPDARRVAYVGHKNASDIGANELIVYSFQDGQSRALSVRIEDGLRAGSQHDIAWSPDGGRIVFFGTDTSGRSAVYLVLVSANSVQRICFLNGEAVCPRWSFDGKAIAMMYTENASRATGPLAAAARNTGIIDDHGDVRRIALLDPSTSDLRQISPSDLYVHQFCWSPDGRSLAAIAAPPPGDNNWYIADLYRIDASSGDAMKLLSPGMQIAVPRWSPDGSQIAFIGGLMSDEGWPAGDIYVLSARGGQPRNVTPGMRMSACWLRWSDDSHKVQFVADDSGATAIASVDLASSRVTKLWRGLESLSAEYGNFKLNLSESRDGQSSALVRESFENPPEIWTGPIGKWRQVTHLNSHVRRFWGPSMSVNWKSDSLTIQGWVTLPANHDSAHLYPMAVIAHGGPTGTIVAAWPDDLSLVSVFSRAGYCVFQPNVRGSTGCGESFVRANVRDFGYGDFRDIVNGTEAMIKRFPIDRNRLGIIGWSYGGYMAMWAVTQTDVFHASVAGAGIANWLSYYAQNGINRWSTPFFGGVVYDVPEVYARSSPINFIKQAKTPTLLVVGEGDLECPAPQSYEFWRGLQHVGVKTQLYVCPNTGHGLSDQQWQEFCQRSLKWFDENMR